MNQERPKKANSEKKSAYILTIIAPVLVVVVIVFVLACYFSWQSEDANTINSAVAILIVATILAIYTIFVIAIERKRRKKIEAENLLLEESNRAIDEENRKAFAEISEIRDIIASANMGTWRIELFENQEPRMYVDDKMRELLGISNSDEGPEKTYKDWFDNITPDALQSVLKSVARMEEGYFDENTYLWIHPFKGLRYVRCGGTSQKLEGGYVLRGYHYDVDELVRTEQAQVVMLKEALEDKNEYYSALGALGDIFYSMHVIDLTDDTVLTFSARDFVAEIVNRENGAAEMMHEVMDTLTSEECREEALKFTDLSTLPDRMQNKMYISSEFVGRHLGWFLACFIVMEKDQMGRPTKVIYATRDIDEEKKQNEKLLYKSQTDELTKVYNRRAYEEALIELDEKGLPDDFVYIAFDINGLKVTNDTIGHEAGDELIVGSSLCIKKALEGKGRVFRTGGDEFVALANIDADQVKALEEQLKESIDEWHGKLVESLSISYGIVTRTEMPEASLHDISLMADKRLYEAKSLHYRKTGVDRRGRKDAHIALVGMYVKILKINVTEDSYQIIDLKQGEPIEGFNAYASISEWFIEFGKRGFVHEDDLLEYYTKTDLHYLQSYFSKNEGPLRITYRRKFGEEYEPAVMELLKANDYTENSQSLFLYVKNIKEQ